MIQITLPDGSQRQFPGPVTVAEVAASIGSGLAKAALAGKVDGKVVDTSYQIKADSQLSIVTAKDADGLEVIRHSTAHLLAYAVKELFPKAQVTIGPVIENGFFYDFSFERPFTPDDLAAIEKKMSELAAKDEAVQRRVLPRDAAVAHFKSIGEHYKAEIIGSIAAGEDVSLYREGSFEDLCRGPHVPSTGKLKHFKLMKVAGAYWRGDHTKEMLQRIYGTAWATKEELQQYLTMLEEAEKRDHRKLGRELDLFHVDEHAPGLVFWHPKGWTLWQGVEQYMRKVYQDNGYQEVKGPQIIDKSLWEKTGHWDKYRENMFTTESEKRDYALKPMNCPGHILIFKQGIKSYRDLPLRYGEFGQCHRNEPSGGLHGIMRVRGFTQDDGHIFCTPEQIQNEMKLALRFVQEAYRDLTFDEVKFYLSTRPEKRVGAEELWDTAENALVEALKSEGIDYILNPGDGAFYGPKIDIKVKDAIGRFHQCATIQLDFQTAGRLGASYVSAGNKPEVPVMIHRAVLGSVERFMGVFIEHTAGHFPIGLAPVQARIVTVKESCVEWGEQVRKQLFAAGVRVDCDFSNDTLSAKVREAQVGKIPYMLVIGDKEVEHRTITPRYRDGKNREAMSPQAFVLLVKEESGVFWGIDVNQH
ncbi:threonine--tRNA ligase [bacterium]|nr:threonine--tRNA ligase [bacterium]